jgi:hypothetical protein
LVLSDVERPVFVEVPAEVQRAEFDNSFGHGRSPAHAGTLHAVLDEILAGPFDGTTILEQRDYATVIPLPGSKS